MITAATLFSGIGAPEMAMPHWHWPWHAEIEKFPSAVMAARHPQSVNLGDVSAHDFAARAARIARPDVLVFGSPCQSFSVAGKRLGLDDARGNLALVALRLARELRPEWLVFENVPGLLSSADGRDFGLFLRTVEECGYLGCWRVLDAQFAGVPQRRRRIFFVGRLGDWRGPAAVLLERESLCGDSPPRRDAGKGIAPTISARPTGGGGLGTDFDLDGGLIAFGGNNTSGPIDVATACQAHGGPHGRLSFESETFILPILEAGARTGVSTDDIRAGIGIGEPGDPMFTLQSGKQHAIAFTADDYKTGSFEECDQARALTTSADRSRAAPTDGHQQSAIAFDTYNQTVSGETVQTLCSRGDTPGGNAHLVPAVAFQSRIARNGRGQPSDIVPALNGSDAGATSDMRPLIAFQSSQSGVREVEAHATLDSNNGSRRHNGVATGSAVRRLTPRECERLQGCADDYTLVTYRGKPAADGPRYKALGNSMAVPVMRWILTRIEQFQTETKVAA